MIKLVAVVGKRPGWTDEEWYSHYFDQHGPLVAATKGFTKNTIRYRQNYVLGDTSGNSFEHTHPRNGVTELWFHGMDALARAFSAPDYQAMVRPDEALFADPESIILGIGTEHSMYASTVPSGDKAIAKQSRINLFVFGGIDHRSVTQHPLPPNVRRHVQTRFIPTDFTLGNSHRFAMVDEFWFDSEEDARGIKASYRSGGDRRLPSAAGSVDELILVTRSHVVFNPEVLP
jgi:hypothetical protein